ncbi:MAG: archaemetzincin, partial [Planctomycetota bacterium]
LALLLVLAGVVLAYYRVTERRIQGGSGPADLARLAARRAPVWSKFDENGFEHMKPPVLGEWLYRFPEHGQTFEEYTAGPVNKRRPGRETIYLRPLGPLSARSREALASVASFTRAFFQLETKVLPEEPIFAEALVRERRGGDDQYDADAIVKRLIAERPDDAIVYAGVADQDLFSDELNFVFGIGTFGERVGVYSFVRFAEGEGRASEKVYRRRAFQLVSHELGHIFTLHHCIFYMCEQNGSLSLYESDKSPSHACPVCLAKLEWNVGFDRKKRYADLAAVYRDEGLEEEAKFCEARSK